MPAWQSQGATWSRALTCLESRPLSARSPGLSSIRLTIILKPTPELGTFPFMAMKTRKMMMPRLMMTLQTHKTSL